MTGKLYKAIKNFDRNKFAESDGLKINLVLDNKELIISVSDLQNDVMEVASVDYYKLDKYDDLDYGVNQQIEKVVNKFKKFNNELFEGVKNEDNNIQQ